MKLICQKTDMIEAVQTVSKAVATKPQTPIFSGIYMKADNDTLELQAKNNEIGLVVRIPADIKEPGHIVVTGRYIQEVVRKLPGDSLSLEYDNEEKVVRIKSNTSKFTLLSMSADDFPPVRYLDAPLTFTMPDAMLSDLIRKTSFACSNDESRPIFTGCYMAIDGNMVTVAATNSHRLSVKTATFDEPVGNTKLIVPSKVLNDLLHTMSGGTPSNVRISCTSNQISFEFRNIYMTSRLIDGAFPDYKNIIPDSFATEVIVDRGDLEAAADRVSLISRANDFNIVRFVFSEGQIHISSNNPDIGNAEEVVNATVKGPDVNIAFNVHYITDVLKNMDSDECRFALNQSLDTTAIHDGDDSTFIYLVTPVRTAH